MTVLADVCGCITGKCPMIGSIARANHNIIKLGLKYFSLAAYRALAHHAQTWGKMGPGILCPWKPLQNVHANFGYFHFGRICMLWATWFVDHLYCFGSRKTAFLQFLDQEIRLIHFCNFWIQKLQVLEISKSKSSFSAVSKWVCYFLIWMLWNHEN